MQALFSCWQEFFGNFFGKQSVFLKWRFSGNGFGAWERGISEKKDLRAVHLVQREGLSFFEAARYTRRAVTSMGLFSEIFGLGNDNSFIVAAEHFTYLLLIRLRRDGANDRNDDQPGDHGDGTGIDR